MRADATSNRRDLIEAGRRAIATSGSTFSLRTVAHEARVGIATLYRHFPTRDDLVIGVIKDTWGRIADVINQHESEWANEPALGWSRTVHGIAELELGAVAFQLAPAATSNPVLASSAEPLRAKALELIEPLLGRARASGLVPVDTGATELLIAIAAVSRPLPDAVTQLYPFQSHWMVDLLLKGLKAEAGAPTGASAPKP